MRLTDGFPERARATPNEWELSWCREQQGKETKLRPELGAGVKFGGKPLEKVFHRTDRTKLQLLPRVPDIIEKGDYLGSQDNHNPRKPNIKAYHRFAGVVTLGDRDLLAKVLVFEDRNGHFLYDVNYGPDVEMAQGRRPKKGTVPEPEAPSRTPSNEAGAAEPLDASIGGINLEVTPSLNLDKRGTIHFGPDRQFRIELLKDADLSTFLHETGLFYLEVFGDIVDDLRKQNESNSLSETQGRMIGDYEKALAWLGVESRGQITRGASRTIRARL